MKPHPQFLQFRCALTPWSQSISLWAHTRSHEGKVSVVAPSMQMTQLDDPLAEPPPTLEFGNTGAQQLMDELWRCGLRPSEGSGSAGAMAATQKHLEDMRTLVFKKDGAQ